MGSLILVATPIGNLGDLSPRAIEALAEADLVLAEDTRRTGLLLQHVDVDTPMRSYHEHNEDQRAPEVVEQIAAGATVVLVTDAGTPGVSDPGYRLVTAVVDAGLPVGAIPGPSAVLHALVVSGLPTDRFTFEGFLPRKGSARRDRLTELADEPRTMVLFVSPHRAKADLRDLAASLGTDRPAALARELTKLHEEVVRDTLGGLAELTSNENPRGEVTLVIAGRREEVGPPPTGPELAADVAERMRAGTSKKQAIADVARDRDVPKKVVYQAVLDAGS